MKDTILQARFRTRSASPTLVGSLGTWPWLAIAIVIVALLVRVVSLGNGRGPVDDAFITFRYAWNLAHSGGWFFNYPGESTQAASSPLWVLLLSIFAPAFGPADVRVVPLLTLVGVGLQLVAVSVLLLAAARNSSRRWTFTFAGALFAISPTLVDQSFFGMESGLTTTILAVVFVARRWGTAWSLGLGLLGLTRPETVVTVMAPVLAVNVVGDLLERDPAPVRWARSIAIASAPGLLTLAGIAWLRDWATPIPTTLAAKNATYGLLCGFGGLVDRLWFLGALSGVSMATAPVFVGVLLALGIVGLALRALHTGPGGRELVQWTVAWIANVFFQVVVIQTSFPWYWATAGVLALFVTASAIPVPSSRASALAVASLLGLLGGIDAYKSRHFSVANLDVRQLPTTLPVQNYIETGLAIRSLTGSSATVMAEPAGAVGFFSGARVADTIHLVSARVPYPPVGTVCWFDQAVDIVKPDVIVLREQEIQTNRCFICGYRMPLSCRGRPIPDGYARVVEPPVTFGPVSPLTILVKK